MIDSLEKETAGLGLDKECRNCLSRRDALEHRVRRPQRFADGDVHIEIAVSAEAPDEADLRRFARQGDVIAQHRLFVDLPYRIIGDVVGTAAAAELAIADRARELILLPGREMLVLGDAREGHGLVAVIHDRRALEVAVGAEGFEVERAIAQPSEPEIEIAIDRPAVDHMREALVEVFETRAEP